MVDIFGIDKQPAAHDLLGARIPCSLRTCGTCVDKSINWAGSFDEMATLIDKKRSVSNAVARLTATRWNFYYYFINFLTYYSLDTC